MKVFEALYCESIHESAHATLSLHKTKLGARNAVASQIRKERKEHYEKGGYGEMVGEYWNQHKFEAWAVIETEVEE